MRQMSRCQVSYFHTDGCPSYRRVLPQTRHSASKGGTLRIERHNLNFRTRLKRLQRWTICFPRSEEMHDAVIKLFVHHSGISQHQFRNTTTLCQPSTVFLTTLRQF
jgi:insertion element IS1 protein InsB